MDVLLKATIVEIDGKGTWLGGTADVQVLVLACNIGIRIIDQIMTHTQDLHIACPVYLSNDVTTAMTRKGMWILNVPRARSLVIELGNNTAVAVAVAVVVVAAAAAAAATAAEVTAAAAAGIR